MKKNTRTNVSGESKLSSSGLIAEDFSLSQKKKKTSGKSEINIILDLEQETFEITELFSDSLRKQIIIIMIIKKT